MLKQISQEIKEVLAGFLVNDNLIFNNKLIQIDQKHFNKINTIHELENNKTIVNEKTIAFIDGGQAEIISAGNFCLSFIRVAGIVFRGNKKIDCIKHEFYLFTRAKYINDDLFYESKVYHLTDNITNNITNNLNLKLISKLISENDLLISSNDTSIKTGTERAPIGKVANVARRFAELALANKIKADFIVLDGTLEPTFKNEEKYLPRASGNVAALAKSSSLFTTSGNSPVILLNKIGPDGCWSYFVEGKTNFVKLHEKAKHVFRFEGNKEVLSFLVENSRDALFLGYPYGLIFADKMARVSNKEKHSLIMQFLLRKENQDIAAYLNSANAHHILDNLG